MVQEDQIHDTAAAMAMVTLATPTASAPTRTSERSWT